MKSVEYPARYAARKKSAQRVAFLLFRFLSLFVAFILFAILGFIIYKGAGVLSWDFLTEAPSDGMTSGGIFPAIVGTLYLMLGSAIVAFPIGIMSGIYMSEFASKGWVVKLIRHMTNNLSGVPSIVFGLFGMALFVKYLNFGDSILAGSLTLGLLSLPLVIRTTEEALKDIPDSMREGSLALGASKLQTIWRVILPMGMPRIITGLQEFDRVMGGGLVAGGVSLIGGDPGIGKSTLLLQVMHRLVHQDVRCLYVSGEESPGQIPLRAKRLGLEPQGLRLMSEIQLEKIESTLLAEEPQFVVIDSIQTLFPDQPVLHLPGHTNHPTQTTRTHPLVERLFPKKQSPAGYFD